MRCWQLSGLKRTFFLRTNTFIGRGASMQVVTPSALFAGHNNRHHWAALTTTNDGDKSGVGEGFERSALSPALNTPALQVKIGNSKGGFEARRRCRPRHFLP